MHRKRMVNLARSASFKAAMTRMFAYGKQLNVKALNKWKSIIEIVS